MGAITSWMDRVFYGDYVDSWDNHAFGETVSSFVKPEHHVLDVGAGRGNLEMMDFGKQCKFFAGVDPGEVVFENPYLHEAKLLAGPRYAIPYEDNSFDIVVSNNVIEHVQDANFYFNEVNRVLRPGGHFFAKTPNANHYVAVLARCTPHWFHEFYNRLRGRREDDTFPTTYVCNSRSAIRQQAELNEMLTEEIKILEGRPEYLRIAVPMYACGLVYEKIVNSTSLLEPVRCVILLHLRKNRQESRRLAA